MQKVDVFVIGGGPAGLAAAIAARRKGFSVMVADGVKPPIDKPCGEGLLPDTIAALQELGVEARASDGCAVVGVRFVGSGSSVAAPFPEGRGIGMRRPVLHRKLMERAQECGVALRWGATVVGICGDGVKLADGLVRAKWIVGADGIASRVRKWSGLEGGTRTAQRWAFRRHYAVKPWSEFMEVYWGDNAQAYVTPVGSEEVCVVVISGQAARDVATEAEFPELARRLAVANCLSAERGAVTLTRRLRALHRERVALIGDASGSVDAITGEGLCLAFRQALALADALEGEDLRQYEEAHRQLARRPAAMGRLMLVLDGRKALQQRVLRALASDEEIFARLLAIHVGAGSSPRWAAAGAMLGWRLVAA